jgi:hypothetical protein
MSVTRTSLSLSLSLSLGRNFSTYTKSFIFIFAGILFGVRKVDTPVLTILHTLSLKMLFFSLISLWNS